jgi:hypothetical protein
MGMVMDGDGWFEMVSGEIWMLLGEFNQLGLE